MSDCIHIFLIGPSASGKTTLQEELETRGFERIISYTTRPPREGEQDGVDYHFITDREFTDAFVGRELAAVRSYHTVFGVWRYAFAWSDLNRAVNSCAVIDPKGYSEIYNEVSNPFGIYMDIPADVRKARLLMRGDHPSEIDRRLEADAEDFADFDLLYKDVCQLRIGQIRPPAIEADRIESYIHRYRQENFS